MHIAFAKPAIRRYLERARSRLTWKRVKARIDIAWITFDLWYSNILVETWREDLSIEMQKQIELRKRLDAARRVL
jgi:hypothetical protein